MDLKTEAEKEKITNENLYNRQMELLRTFLEHGAISQAQFDKSYHDLTVKMYPDKIHESEENGHAYE